MNNLNNNPTFQDIINTINNELIKTEDITNIIIINKADSNITVDSELPTGQLVLLYEDLTQSS